MFSTPNSVVKISRAVLFMLLAALFAVGIGPFTAIARFSPIGGAAAILGVSYCGVQLAMIAYPWRRKSDLLTSALVIAGAFAAIRLLLGRGEPLVDAVVGMLGAVAAYLPVGIEQLRSRARLYGDVLFEVIEIEDRRNQGRRRAPARGDRAAAPVG